MAKYTTGSSSLTFNTTSYACLKDFSYSHAVEEVIEKCSGSSGPVTHVITGGDDYTFTVTHVLESGSSGTTVINALASGTSATDFAYYPEGNSSGKTSLTATEASITNLDYGGDISTAASISITIRLGGTVTFANVA